MTHWADVAAGSLLEGRRSGHVFATAITPSGPIHVGNMREVLTTEAVFRATLDAGGDARLLYIADDYDPLRKVYPFLEGHPETDYRKHVGKPLKEIPCPCGGHEDYAAHFLEPFLSDLVELGITPDILSAYAMYHEGRYVEATTTALDATRQVRSIVEEVSKRQLPKDWAPFNPQCPVCRRVTGTRVLVYEYPELRCRCDGCAEGTADPEAGTFTLDVREGGGGKLPWRVDWPARWSFLGVTFEAFGKDHGASGGSWDSGVRLVREVFEGREPQHIMYEFLNLKGRGAMHSSRGDAAAGGTAVSAADVLRMTPPEVLRYLLVRQSPRKHIDFEPGLGVLQLVDEFDRHERIRFGAEENPGDVTEVDRVYELSCPHGPPDRMPTPINFRHLVTVVQIADDVDGVESVLRRTGEVENLDEDDRARLTSRVAHVRYWLDHFAPDNVRFSIAATLPAALGLTDDDRSFLAALAGRLEQAAWSGQAIHDAIHEAAGDAGLPQAQAFRAVYRSILGQDRGPRAGFFLASQERGWIVRRLREAVKAA